MPRCVDHLHVRIDRHVEEGVAATHPSAAAVADAEVQMFLQDNPISPGAGRAVNDFETHCERRCGCPGATSPCLVPA